MGPGTLKCKHNDGKVFEGKVENTETQWRLVTPGDAQWHRE